MLNALKATTPLDGRSVTIGKTALWVLADRPLYSLSVPLGGDAEFEAALSSNFGLSRPAAGQFTDSEGYRLCDWLRISSSLWLWRPKPRMNLRSKPN